MTKITQFSEYLKYGGKFLKKITPKYIKIYTIIQGHFRHRGNFGYMAVQIIRIWKWKQNV